jgi:hypothetical protein
MKVLPTITTLSPVIPITAYPRPKFMIEAGRERKATKSGAGKVMRIVIGTAKDADLT